MTIRLLLVDDHPVVRTGIHAVLANEPDITVVAEASDGRQGVTLYAQHRPDVTLMDLRMPQMDGVTAIREIIARDRAARIIALTTFDGDADIYQSLEAGACGYLIKDMMGENIVAAVRAAAARRRVIPLTVAARLAEFTPRIDLTLREVEVLRLAGKGLRNKEIGRVINRTEETVKVHLKHIMAKLGTSDRTEAVTRALQRGILHLGD
jgi:two-component system, NarL family, response regulator